MSARTASQIAWSVWGLSLALTALSLVLLAANRAQPHVHIFDYWLEDLVITVQCSTVGAVIISRRPDNFIGWLFCTIGLIGGVDHFSAQYATYALLAAPGTLAGGEALAWVRGSIWVPHIGLFVLLGLLFPNGRLPGRRWQWLLWLNATVVVLGALWIAFTPGPVDGLGPINNPLGVEPLGILGTQDTTNLVETLLFALAFVAAVSLFVRLRRARGDERQQLKWFAYAGAVTTVSGAIVYPASEVTGAAWVGWVAAMIHVLGLVGLPVAVALAVLKYRLYDIDVIIHRTLVYSTLTGLLAAVYLGGVVLLQSFFRTLTGQENPLAIVVSTLASVALFGPLRDRLQAFVDRRFYRRKYDAAQTLAAFNARLRDEVELSTLSDDLVAVVAETMQPTHVSLWLRKPPVGSKQ